MVKLWIHVVSGDTHGNNRLVGHFNGSGKLAHAFRNCTCPWGNMDATNPQCVFITPEYVSNAIRLSNLGMNKVAREAPMKAISKHKIELAFNHPHVPLSDSIHGIYKMLPPDILHVISEGISKYIFESLQKTIDHTTKSGQATIAAIQRVF